jgi:hypothetical protein
MYDNQTSKRPYKEPLKVWGKYLFGYWLPFFGFRDSFPPTSSPSKAYNLPKFNICTRADFEAPPKPLCDKRWSRAFEPKMNCHFCSIDEENPEHAPSMP